MSSFSRRDVFRGMVGGLSVGFLPQLFAQNSNGQFKPTRPVKLISPLQAGGATDAIIRPIAQKLSDLWGQSVIVENKPGATGTIAGALVKRAAPDGYTLFVSSIGTFVVAPHLIKSVTYDPIADFDYISLPFQAPNVLVTGSARPERTIAEVLAALKNNPGKLTFASSGVGASDHLSAELLWQQTNTTGVHVPYKGGAPALQDTLGGQVDFFMTNINAVLPQIRAGKLHPIAITADKRSPTLPDVPTFGEAGVQGMEVYGWQGLTAPKGLPADIKKTLSDAAILAMKDPATVKKLQDLGITIVANTPEEFTRFVTSENQRWKNLIIARKITVD
jgi:tripartite-type tricarboxylate transporter receptor subunit TctC